jgi:putative adenylate-forming enzyme
MIRAIHDYIVLKHRQKNYTQKQIERFQFKHIKKMINYAKKHSPFYEHQFKDIEIHSMEDFRKLSIINKQIMMENFSILNTEHIVLADAMSYALEKEENKDYLGYYQNRFVLGLSSGTSGNKGLYITPKEMTKRLPAVFLARGGVSIKDLPLRILFCLRVFSQGFNDINAPFIKLKYTSTMTPPEEVIKMLNEYRINVWMAPPSMVRLILPYQKQLKIKLKKLITYAEVLTNEDKKRFEEAFQTQVLEIYQASEGQIASPCKLGHLHINEDLVHIDLYDENNQLIDEPHVVGHKMVLTNLINKAQPLIRYQMNDMIVLDEKCACGSNFRTIKNILGRSDDLLYFYNENHEVQYVFPDLFSRWIITTSDDIREFQVFQELIGHLIIKIDAPKEFNIAKLTKIIYGKLASYHLSANLVISIEKLELPKDKNKFKRFISSVKIT